jgi:signal transduction histidine kinase
MSAHAHPLPRSAATHDGHDPEVSDGPHRRLAEACPAGSQPVDKLVGTPQFKDQIVAMVAHELRGPLTPLKLAAGALRLASASQPEMSRLIDIIDRQLTQIDRLAEDLSDSTRIARGTLRLHVANIGLIDVLDDPLEGAAAAAAERGQTFTVQAPDRTLRLQGDPVRLMQAFSNILHNAVKYTPANGCINVTVRADGKNLVVSVRDNGQGISDTLLPHVFDLFARCSRTIAGSSDGLGIGLAVVKAVAESHGGTVSALSAGPGAGSEFTLRLPIVVE